MFPIDSPKNLEIKGSLHINPLAELLREIADNRFNGSLRMAHEAQKIIVYFDAGETVFAVSNARQHRFFEMLLQAGKFSRDELAAIADFTNDLALKEFLLKDNLMGKAEIDDFFARQISEILKSAMNWKNGEWTFSPLVRIKGTIRFQISVSNLLIEFARNVAAAEAARKFQNSLELLSVKSAMPAGVNLSPQESFVFSRFEAKALTIEEIQTLSGLPDIETFQILYALWLGGFINRQNRQTAFSEREISAIQSAKLTVIKDETKPIAKPSAIKFEMSTAKKPDTICEKELTGNAEEIASNETGKKEVALEDYLRRIEKAGNFYEIFALSPDSGIAEIKQTYFSLAKRFHPDLFHKEADTNLLRRIQKAFSELARAYETLKHESTREVYDFKMRKELADTNEERKVGATAEKIDLHKQNEQAVVNFEQGFNFLMNENHPAAIQFLARAVHFDKNNARYHAYYAKALSADNRQRHKAEAAFQTAIKLDGENADYRLMLAEFFAQVGLVKRAEGELKRLLAIFPSNREAQTMLDSLMKK